MCQKFVYTNAKIGLASASGEIFSCANRVKPSWLNVHPTKLICQLVLNLKMPITKVAGASFGTPKDYNLQNFTMIPLSIRSAKPQLQPHLCPYSKLVSPIIFVSSK